MKIRVIAVAAICALALSGCSTKNNSGTALVVNGNTTTTKQITAQVDEIRNEIQQLPVGTIEKIPSVVMLTRMVVDRNITTQLVDLALAKKNITVSDEEVQAFADSVYTQYGKDKILIQIMGTNGVSSTQVNSFMRLVYAENALAKALAPTQSQVGQTQALVEYVGSLSEEVGVKVSPRFGSWDPTQLQVVLGDETLSFIEKDAQGVS